MVIYAIGGVVVGGAIVKKVLHEDHSDYSDWSNHSDYSDYAERQRREREAKKDELRKEISSIERRLNECKSSNIASYLSGSPLANSSATSLADSSQLTKMNNYVLDKIKNDEKAAVEAETKPLHDKIARIDAAIEELEAIKKKLQEKQ